ncbi:MAG: hypothetical protein WDW38_005346 [Sanguina aurantia]
MAPPSGPSGKAGGGSAAVQVLMRIRPMLARELAFDHAVEVIPGKGASSGPRIKAYVAGHEISSEYDCVFGEDSTQEAVYSRVRDSVLASMAGYNSTVFAYGQTGTGKTYTMMGEHGGDLMAIKPKMFATAEAAAAADLSSSRLGIIPRAVSDLFRAVAERQREEGVTVQHISHVTALVAKGTRHRAVRNTEMNLNSSRSHAILQLVLEQWPGGGDAPGGGREAGTVVRSKVNFVDLAGSERWHDGVAMVADRVAEMTAINSSLSALAGVVAALTERSKFVPYRDSKLTHLLQDSLGGNCRTTIIATLSPSADAFDESTSTMRFADRARSICNNPVVNTSTDMGSVLALKEKEIARLRMMLSAVYAKEGVNSPTRASISLQAPSSPGPARDTRVTDSLNQELEAARRALSMERALRAELELRLKRVGTSESGSRPSILDRDPAWAPPPQPSQHNKLWVATSRGTTSRVLPAHRCPATPCHGRRRLCSQSRATHPTITHCGSATQLRQRTAIPGPPISPSRKRRQHTRRQHKQRGHTRRQRHQSPPPRSPLPGHTVAVLVAASRAAPARAHGQRGEGRQPGGRGGPGPGPCNVGAAPAAARS